MIYFLITGSSVVLIQHNSWKPATSTDCHRCQSHTNDYTSFKQGQNEFYFGLLYEEESLSIIL